MKILRLLAKSLSNLEKSLETMLEPESNIAKPKGALVKVRLIDLLPPELPGWTSNNPNPKR